MVIFHSYVKLPEGIYLSLSFWEESCAAFWRLNSANFLRSNSDASSSTFFKHAFLFAFDLQQPMLEIHHPDILPATEITEWEYTPWAQAGQTYWLYSSLSFPACKKNQTNAGLVVLKCSEPLWPFGWVESAHDKRSSSPPSQRAHVLLARCSSTSHPKSCLKEANHLRSLTVYLFNNNLQMFQANAGTILFWVRLWTNSRLGVQKVVVNAPVRLQVQHRDFSDGNLCDVWPCDLPCVWWPPAIW